MSGLAAERMNEIDRTLEELTLDKNFVRAWNRTDDYFRKVVSISEKEVKVFEGKIGTPLPSGFRQFILKYEIILDALPSLDVGPESEAAVLLLMSRFTEAEKSAQKAIEDDDGKRADVLNLHHMHLLFSAASRGEDIGKKIELPTEVHWYGKRGFCSRGQIKRTYSALPLASRKIISARLSEAWQIFLGE